MKKGKVHEVSERELKEKLSAGGDDRRSDERVEARLQIEVPLADWKQVRNVYTTNISKGGLLFTLASPASMPAAVDLTLTLPDGTTVTLQSEVRHVARREGSGEFDIGVQFQELEPAKLKALEEALARHPG
jgi:c-di-GMP-binding flagellar brake protein YcgR